jgi:predicted nucleotidyltransferase
MKISEIRKKTVPVFQAYDVKFAGLFGSYARGKPGTKSDIDIAVVFNRSIGLFEFVGLKLDLKKALKKPVDLVTYRTMYPYVKQSAKRDMKKLYGKAPQR